MKHTIEYDLENPLDSARFELNCNGMLNMSHMIDASMRLNMAVNDLNSNKITLEEFKDKVLRSTDLMDSDLESAYEAFWYIQNDGKCDQCAETACEGEE